MLTGFTLSALSAPILHFLWSSCPYSQSQSFLAKCLVTSLSILSSLLISLPLTIFALILLPPCFSAAVMSFSLSFSLIVIVPSIQIKTLECIFYASSRKSKTIPQSGQNQALDLKSCPKHSFTMNKAVIFPWYLGLHISDFHSSLDPYIKLSSESCMFFLLNASHINFIIYPDFETLLILGSSLLPQFLLQAL